MRLVWRACCVCFVLRVGSAPVRCSSWMSTALDTASEAATVTWTTWRIWWIIQRTTRWSTPRCCTTATPSAPPTSTETGTPADTRSLETVSGVWGELVITVVVQGEAALPAAASVTSKLQPIASQLLPRRPIKADCLCVHSWRCYSLNWTLAETWTVYLQNKTAWFELIIMTTKRQEEG